MKRKILVVEDEENIREFVVINLQHRHYEVEDYADGLQALEAYEASEGDFDLAILDIMMPELDGFAVAQKIRERSARTGIIFLTALSQEMDKVKGLLMGADDYITKPFSPSELVARVESVLRRVEQIDGGSVRGVLSSGVFQLDLEGRSLRKEEERVVLTNTEMLLMEHFLTHKNQTLSRREILTKVWGGEGVSDLKTVDVNVRRLRMKIEEQPSTPEYIVTVWGAGYKWVET